VKPECAKWPPNVSAAQARAARLVASGLSRALTRGSSLAAACWLAILPHVTVNRGTEPREER
jgi:hypothetical protein